ncbi:MAG TPA: hypothetical protein VFD49_03640 [Candidatus Dormibacteraeota bacterium]|nr:hypothetical protein [Candidatus Dormibacteraeota bacterium]
MATLVATDVAADDEEGMPPVAVYFNGSVNLPDAEMAMREIAGGSVSACGGSQMGRPAAVDLLPVPETIDHPAASAGGMVDQPAEGYRQLPRLRLADGVVPQEPAWSDPEYTAAYQE